MSGKIYKTLVTYTKDFFIVCKKICSNKIITCNRRSRREDEGFLQERCVCRSQTRSRDGVTEICFSHTVPNHVSYPLRFICPLTTFTGVSSFSTTEWSTVLDNFPDSDRRPESLRRRLPETLNFRHGTLIKSYKGGSRLFHVLSHGILCVNSTINVRHQLVQTIPGRTGTRMVSTRQPSVHASFFFMSKFSDPEKGLTNPTPKLRRREEEAVVFLLYLQGYPTGKEEGKVEGGCRGGVGDGQNVPKDRSTMKTTF